VHPQSIVHSMIEYQDNSVIAQMGSPDMRLPIQYALTYPDRLPCDAPQLNLVGKTLTFDNPDYQTFPCLKLAIDAIAKGGLYPTILNAANEIAVSLFLQEKITFMQISKLVNDALTNINLDNIEYNYDNIIKVDNMARQYVLERR
ncbi:MAG: 1-deoxy-D-xylulose-5-phosphate reductoisomerase, partial [Oscillospiraceae bacterium]